MIFRRVLLLLFTTSTMLLLVLYPKRINAFGSIPKIVKGSINQQLRHQHQTVLSSSLSFITKQKKQRLLQLLLLPKQSSSFRRFATTTTGIDVDTSLLLSEIYFSNTTINEENRFPNKDSNNNNNEILLQRNDNIDYNGDTITTSGSSSTNNSIINNDNYTVITSQFCTHVRIKSTSLLFPTVPIRAYEAIDIVLQLIRQQQKELQNQNQQQQQQQEENNLLKNENTITHHEKTTTTTTESSSSSSSSSSISLILEQQPKKVLNAQELIYLGSIWVLPGNSYAGTSNDNSTSNTDTTTNGSTITNTTNIAANTATGDHTNSSTSQQHQQQQQQQQQRKRRRQSTSLLFRLHDPNFLLYDGYYIRIHHHPRRFHQVYKYCWDDTILYNNRDSITATNNENNIDASKKQGVIIATDKTIGYMVINKPEQIPIHMTVDNCRENVASCIYEAAVTKKAKQQTTTTIDANNESTTNTTTTTFNSGSNNKDGTYYNNSNVDNADNDEAIYVSTPQRLDQNTSGLFVVATSKHFANFYARLLQSKTEQLLSLSSSSKANHNNNNNINTNSDKQMVGGIHKSYRCLVCIIPPTQSSSIEASSDPTMITGSWSIERAADTIRSYVDNSTIMRHYLEPSVRAPKRFVQELPQHVKDRLAEAEETGSRYDEAQWQESLLRITKASTVYPLIGNTAATTLAQSLWTNEDGIVTSKPSNCYAIMELEIELLTGRTHQIRGQLSSFGFPLVGDVQYGGSDGSDSNRRTIVTSNDNDSDTTTTSTTGTKTKKLFNINEEQHTDRLALQCCHLSFVDPDIVYETPPPRRYKKKLKKRLQSVYHADDDVETTYVPSQRWNEFHLDSAWWTNALQTYTEQTKSLSDNEQTTTMRSSSTGTSSSTSITVTESIVNDDNIQGTTTIVDTSNGHQQQQKQQQSAQSSKGPRPHLLPDRVQLSPGKNKYVLARAIHPDEVNTDTIHWFVKSSSPSECGGPYHGNVAQDLREWIEGVGYNVTITGGGRIDYNPITKTAVVYGFSYGFGKGDHKLAASIITNNTNGTIIATYDNSDDLY